MLIGLTGKKLAGKDTVGRYLIDHHGFTRLGFADKMKDGLCALINIPRDEEPAFKENGLVTITYTSDSGEQYTQQMTGRVFEQRFGTDMGRNVFGQDFWVDQVLPDNETSLAPTEYNVVVTDVRFDNEAKRIKDLGGVIVEIQRPTQADDDSHVSEAGISTVYIDQTIRNSSSLVQLFRATEETLRRLQANGIS